MHVTCPACSGMVAIPFPSACPLCFSTFDGIMGKGTSSFQIKNNQEHRDLLYGRDIALYKGKTYNASFDFFGEAMLTNLVRLGLSFGHRATIPSVHGGHLTPVIVSYTPQIIGSGTSQYTSAGPLGCSGLLLMSPGSLIHSHSFPVLDDYVNRTFAGIPAFCTLCGKATGFGHGLCADCYAARDNNWLNFL